MNKDDVTQIPESKAPETAYEWGWRGFNAYDSPMKAALYGSVTNPQYLGHDKWVEWMKEHYIAKKNHP